jgi:EAL domain-containing protein (putative c-di-GMP-specific phosphodiesterase class I)
MAEHRVALDHGMELVRAIDDEQLFLEYQPVVDLREERIVRFEALVRWQHPIAGRLLPDSFLGSLAALGLTHQLTLYVARKAAEACLAWQDQAPGVGVSINVWPDDLSDAQLYRDTATATDFTFEIIEVGGDIAVPDQLPEVPIRLSIDDYGAGLASLARLRLPCINEIKLDRSLVQDLCRDRRARSIIGSTVALADELGLSLVVEGIEDAQAARVCVELGVRLGQGFAFGRAGAPDAHLADVAPAEPPGRTRPSARCRRTRRASR